MVSSRVSWAKHPIHHAGPFALAVTTLPSPLPVTWHPLLSTGTPTKRLVLIASRSGSWLTNGELDTKKLAMQKAFSTHTHT